MVFSDLTLLSEIPTSLPEQLCYLCPGRSFIYRRMLGSSCLSHNMVQAGTV